MQASATSIQARDRLILAVDTSSIDEARRYLDELHEHVGVFKIGLQLFTHYGPAILKDFQSAGSRVFLDCKFLDIPNTVAKAAEEATALGVQMFTIHACGGRKMLTEASAAVKTKSAELGVSEPIILAVTVLTSISPEVLNAELNVAGTVEDQVSRLAAQCRESGVKGLVASPEEVLRLRKELGNDIVIVTPGVRPGWAEANDQSRFTSPAQAIKNGSDYLVVGRPITKAANQKDAAKRIVDEIESALSP
ncbi:MAG: orotidine-5'-phosphate decarboxylase [Candidatus Obscuribacterales bacterium]|nr:orotidine-5'-phosphate decarboxylase [Candidatus Obscuribacterales bacterium]